MTSPTKAAELAAKLDAILDGPATTTTAEAAAIREAAALLRASEGRVPEVIEQIAQQWDGCTYDSPGETLDIGADIRVAADRMLTAAPHPPAQQAEPDVLPAPDEKKLCAALSEHILSSDAAGIPAVSRQDFRAGVDFARRYYASPPPHKAEGAEPQKGGG
jgi:hypothetical protein